MFRDHFPQVICCRSRMKDDSATATQSRSVRNKADSVFCWGNQVFCCLLWNLLLEFVFLGIALEAPTQTTWNVISSTLSHIKDTVWIKIIRDLELVYDKHEREFKTSLRKLKFLSTQIDSRVHVATENMLHVKHFYI